MLVLTRKAGQRIVVDGKLIITPLEIDRDGCWIWNTTDKVGHWVPYDTDIEIAAGVKLRVFRNGAGSVKIGITAVRTITIHREEVWKRICTSLQQSTHATPRKVSARPILGLKSNGSYVMPTAQDTARFR